MAMQTFAVHTITYGPFAVITSCWFEAFVLLLQPSISHGRDFKPAEKHAPTPTANGQALEMSHIMENVAMLHRAPTLSLFPTQ
jgi:hypothetical protein